LKSFRNINQLRDEKIRLESKRDLLADSIDKNWHELKHSLRPINVVNQIIEKSIQKSESKNFFAQIIRDTFALVAFKLSKAVSEKIENKMNNWKKD